MKLNLKLVGVVGAMTLLAGCMGSGSTAEVQDDVRPTPTTESLAMSLKDALLSGQAMRCTYNDGQGEVSSLVKGSKVRVEGMSMGENQGKGWMINDGEWMYTWSDGEKKGTKFNVQAMKDLGDELAEKNIQNPEDWANEVDAQYKPDCRPASASDDDFVPPADVEFQDMSAMMNGIGNMMQNITPGDLEQMKKLIPSGVDDE